ncbi:MAG: gamma-glutamyl-gamma-aminobutyrate hydrolase family protein [Bacillota bacterium]|nr:gamma-glutamyl-gamma-aminobutyrate hydrolase family protein [Bacillota bacterium]
MKPIIGITTTIIKDSEYKKYGIKHIKNLSMSRVAVDYANAIEQAGGIPFLIPILNNHDEKIIDEIISRIDGIIFTGGEDVDISFYSNEKAEADTLSIMKSNIERDKFELKLLKSAIKLDKPILGICRGIQLINIYFNGTLYKDINSEYKTNINHLGPLDYKNKKIHKINISHDSELFKVYKRLSIDVNSFHHQAIKVVGNSLKVIGRATDGIVEAVEYTGKQWVLGLQYHPEMMFENDKEQLKVFKYFVEKIKTL